MKPMSALKVVLSDTHFSPSGNVSGTVFWDCKKTPERAHIRAFYHTEGSGEVDVVVTATHEMLLSSHSGQSDFRLSLPSEPISYRGTIFSILWKIEFAIFPSKETVVVGFEVKF